MGFASILMLAIGLAMDAMAVSAARGSVTPRVLPRHALLVAVYFGGFQALMPGIGWFLGKSVGPFVNAWTPWLAFLLLGAIGGKMLWEARGPVEGRGPGEARIERAPDPFGARVMLLLAIATSLDALAVGITLPLLHAPLGLSLATIGITTALLSVIGLLAGRRFGGVLGKEADLLGGLVLIGLGSKILIEHLRTP